MRPRHLVTVCVGFLVLCAGVTEQYDAKVVKDVVRLIEAAAQHERTWEWSGSCMPEIDALAQNGKAIAPMLVEIMNHSQTNKDVLADFDTHMVFDQQIQLVLCKMFGEKPQLGVNVYGVRADAKDNEQVKRHWLQRSRVLTTGK